MKKTSFIIGLAAALLAGISAQAQTNPPPPNPITDTGLLNGDLGKLGTDIVGAIATLKPFTSNGEATLQFGAGENTASHEIIVAALVTVPTSDHTAIGFGGWHIGSEWVDANANLQFGVVNNILLLGNVRSFAGDGIAYDFKRHEVANFVFTGQEKNWVISRRWQVGIGYVVANTSDRAGVDVLGGGHVGYHYGNGSGFLGLFGADRTKVHHGIYAMR